MNKNTIYISIFRLLSSGLFFLICIFLPHQSIAAESNIFNAGGGIGTQIERETGLGNTNANTAAETIINLVLGFLGIIMITLFLYGGFLWMTAGGNEEKVGQAKKILTGAVIGLGIVLISAILARVIIQTGIDASGSTDITTTPEAAEEAEPELNRDGRPITQ